MKVLMINSVCGIRSTGRICTDLSGILNAQGHECLIAYGRECVPKKYQTISYRIGSDMDVKLHALKARLFDSAGFGSKKATERLIEKIKTYDPDVIHLHNLHGYYLDIEILFEYLKAAGKPIIWTLHDCWSFTGHCSCFDAVGCSKWETGCIRCPQKWNYPASYLLDRAQFNWKKKKMLFSKVENMVLVTPSNWLAKFVRKSFLGKYDVKVIPNGIDVSVFKPTKGTFRCQYGLKEKHIILGVASAWNERKGLSDFIKLSEMFDESYVVVLVGITEKQKKLLPANIISITRTDNPEELAEIYTTADVFVNPTYEDNYPTVNLEAQACGTPCVTYKTGGSPETVLDECGVVVEKGNIGELAKQIVRICSDGLSNQMEGEQAGLNFDKKRCFEDYIKLYKMVLTK